MSEKRYCQISNDNIQMWAESVGITDLSNDVLKALASDATYRLNQTLSTSKQFMRHSKRKKLTCEDFNRSLKWMDVPPVEGMSGCDNTEWISVPEIGLHDVNDPNVNFFSTALSGDIFYQTGVTFTKAEWAYVSHHKLKDENSFREKRMLPLPLPGELVQYYKTLFSVIVNPSSSLFETMLKDVGSSANIGPLVGTIIDGIVRGTPVVRQKTTILRRLLLVIRSLIFNPNIHLGPDQYIRQIVDILVFYTIKELKINYDTQSIRTLASGILLKLMRTKEDSAWDHAVMLLGEVISSKTRSWAQRAGALNTLLILGPAAFYAAIYPIISKYTEILMKKHKPSLAKEDLDMQTASCLFSVSNKCERLNRLHKPSGKEALDMQTVSGLTSVSNKYERLNKLHKSSLPKEPLDKQSANALNSVSNRIEKLNKLNKPYTKEVLDYKTANGLFSNGLVYMITFLINQLPDRMEITVPMQSKRPKKIKEELGIGVAELSTEKEVTELTTEKDVIEKISEIYTKGEEIFGAPFVMQIPPILLERRNTVAGLSKCEYNPIIKPSLVDSLRQNKPKAYPMPLSAVFTSYRRIEPLKERLIFISVRNFSCRHYKFLRRRANPTPFQKHDKRMTSLNTLKKIRLSGPMRHLAFKPDSSLKRIEDVSIIHRTIL